MTFDRALSQIVAPGGFTVSKLRVITGQIPNDLFSIWDSSDDETLFRRGFKGQLAHPG